ncbi:MAG: TPM domain-containing protein [Ginsengibacter sp.]
MKIFFSPSNQLCILLLSFSINCFSQTQSYQRDINATQISAGLPGSHHFKIPEPEGFVNDFEHLFTPEQVKTLDSTIIAVHNKTSVQIAIITIDSMMVNKNQLEDFTKETFISWGLQVNGQFNGILIGLSNKYKKLRIENGSGVEQALTDYEVQGIVENAFMSYLKENKYFEGTINGLAAIMNKLKEK